MDCLRQSIWGKIFRLWTFQANEIWIMDTLWLCSSDSAMFECCWIVMDRLILNVYNIYICIMGSQMVAPYDNHIANAIFICGSKMWVKLDICTPYLWLLHLWLLITPAEMIESNRYAQVHCEPTNSLIDRGPS